MKNLKKIFMALVLAALIVSSVVTVAIAGDDEVTVSGARELLNAAINAKPAVSDSDPDEVTQTAEEAKIEPLKALYIYLQDLTPDDDPDGYQEVIDRYNQMTFKVAKSIYERAVAEKDIDKKSEILAKLYVYVKSEAPAMCEDDDPEMLVLANGFKCVNDGCGAFREFTEQEYLNGITDVTRCPGLCSAHDQKLVYASSNAEETYTYADFDREYNELSTDIASSILAALYAFNESDSESMRDYYDVLRARKVLLDYLEENPLGAEKEIPESEIYTGDLSEVNSLLKAININASYDDLKVSLGEVYTYLVENPVMPLSSEYQTFINAYSELGSALVKRFSDKVSACSTIDEKIAVFVDFHSYLAGNGETKGLPISEDVVNSFNNLRANFIDEVRAIGDILSVIDEIEYAAPEINYRSDLAEFVAKLAELETALDDGTEAEALEALVIEVYAFVKEKTFDPSDESYGEAIAKYVELSKAYVDVAFVEKIEKSESFENKFAVISDFYAFIATEKNTLCEEVVAIYVKEYNDLVAKAALLTDKELMDTEKLPEYVAPDKKPVVSLGFVLDDLLSVLSDACDEYDEAEDADKAAAFAKMQDALSQLYSYMQDNGIDNSGDEENTDENGYDFNYTEFYQNYSECRSKVVEILLGNIKLPELEEESYDIDGAVAALKAAHDYLNTIPVTYDAIAQFNAKIDGVASATAEEQILLEIESLRLTHVYDYLYGLIDEINDEETAYETALENGVILSSYATYSFDVTDVEHNAYVDKLANAYVKLGELISANLASQLRGASLEECEQIVANYLVYSKTLSAATTTAINEALKSVYNDVKGVTGLEEIAYITVYEQALEKIAKMGDAATLEERIKLFEELYTSFYNGEYATTEFVMGESYAAVLEAYKEAEEAIEEELIALLGSSTSPDKISANLNTVYSIISKCMFSSAVVDEYNEVFASFIESDPASHASHVSDVCKAATYTTPDNFSGLLARVNLALELYLSEGKFSQFNVAYLILSGEQSIDGQPKAIDFGKSDFLNVISNFNDAKTQFINVNTNAFDKAEDLTKKAEILVAAKEDVDSCMYLADLQEGYKVIENKLRLLYKEILDKEIAGYTTKDGETELTVVGFQALTEKLVKHLSACPIDTTYLSLVYEFRSETIESMLNFAHYTVVEQMLNGYEAYAGADRLAYQNEMVDRIDAYVAIYKYPTFNDAEFVETTIIFIFEEYLKKFDIELDSIDGASAKDSRIIEIRDYLVSNNIPEYLLEIYDYRFDLYLDSGYGESDDSEEKTDGSIIAFENEIAKINLDASAEELLLQITNILENISQYEYSSKGRSLESELKAIKTQLENDRESAIEALDSAVSKNEYVYTVFGSYDHDTSGLCATNLNSSANGKHNLVSDSAGKKYAEMRVLKDKEGYIDRSVADGGEGLVVELKLMAPEALNFSLKLVGQDVTLFKFTNNELTYGSYSGYKSGVSNKISAVPGQWISLAVVVDFDDKTAELFVDYASFGKMNLDANFSGHSVTAVRLLPTKSTVAETVTCYDDLKIYSGTSIRKIEKLSEMSVDDQFNAYVEATLNTKFTPMARRNFYYTATGLKDSVGTGSTAHVAWLNAFDIAPVLETINDKYLTELEALADKINLNVLTSATIGNADTTKAVDAVNKYIKNNSKYMDQSGARFKAVNEKLVSLETKKLWFADLKLAVENLTKFHRATTVASLEKHLNAFKEYYDLCALALPSNMEMAAADPICTAFINTIKEDESVTSVISKVSLTSYIESYIPYRVGIQQSYENSIKIIDCVDFIKRIEDESKYSNSEEYYVKLLEIAREVKDPYAEVLEYVNFDYVETYLSVVRSVLIDNNYDAKVSGVQDAISFAEKLNKDLADIRNGIYLKVIKEKLESYLETTSYIEKAGICTYVENYINQYNVDLSGEDGIQYKYALQIYKAELETYKNDFEEVLESNTQAFIGLVLKMQAYVTYEELKPLYDEAIKKYYYSMNVDSAEAQAAVETFEEYQQMILEWESNSEMFIKEVAKLTSARRTAEKFRILVNCANYAQKADDGFAGVSAAFEKYNAALEAYNADIEDSCIEVQETVDVVGAFTSNSVSSAIIAVIRKMINN